MAIYNNFIIHYCRGDYKTVQADNICASAWLDRKIVMVMATGYDPTETGTVIRRQKDGSQVSYPCPMSCVEYNKYMGGVDLGDQYRGYYHVRMKCRNIYKYIINFLFDVTITNSFIFYNISHDRKMKSLKFREMLALELIGNYCTRKRAGRSRSRTIRSLPMLHFPARFPTDHGHKRGKCALCRENKRRMDTQWFCKECDVWLCHTGTEHECFLSWHQRN